VPTESFRDGVRRLVEEGVQLVEVLPHEDEHLPGAITIPLKELDRETTAKLKRDVPVGKMAERMRERGTHTVLVTTSDGRLVGLLYREDAERLAGEQP
jgi:hypothetical protein